MNLSSQSRQDFGESELVQQLEFELKAMREDLQSTIEEQESANEESKAANDEVMSMNEELQSANEELESSKEELQSLNEELATINNELESKVEELETAHSLVNNLLRSTEDATVFLDRDFQIKLFTSPAAQLFSLGPSDVGRPIFDITSKITDPDLLDDCRTVLDKLTTVEREVWTIDSRLSLRESSAAWLGSSEASPQPPLQGSDAPAADPRHFRGAKGHSPRCYLRRILPFRTVDDRIDGVVITLMDITDRKRAEQVTNEARLYADGIVATVREPLVVLDARLQMKSANSAFYTVFQVRPDETQDRPIYEIGNRQWDIPELRTLLEEMLPQNSQVTDYRVSHEFEHIGRRTMLLNARKIKGVLDRSDAILLAIEDITEREQAEDAIRKLSEQLEQRVADQTSEIRLLAKAISHLGEGVLITDDDLEWPGPQIRFVNDAMCRISGYSAEELIGQSPRILQGEETSEATRAYIRGELAANRFCSVELINYRKDRRPYEAELFITPVFDAVGQRTNFVSIHRDITERKQREREAARLAAIVNSSQDAIFSLNLKGVIKTWNQGAEQLYGYSAAEAVGHPIFMVEVPGAPWSWRRILELIQRGEPLAPVATKQQRKDGSQVDVFECVSPIIQTVRRRKDLSHAHVALSVAPIMNESGQVIGVSAIVRDITEQRQAERTLQEREERFRKIFEHAATGIAITDWKGRFQHCNPAYCQMLGYSEAELRKLRLGSLVHPDDSEANLAEEQRLRAEQIPFFEIDNRYTRKDGQTVWGHKFVSTLRDEAGEPAHLLALVTDMTERRRAEQALKEREERMRAILNTASDAIITIDQGGIIESVNHATEQMFGYTQDELLGQNVKILMPPPYRDEQNGYIARYLETGEARMIGIGREAVGRHKDGSTFPIELAVSAVDHLGLFTGIIRDITDRKELQKQILEIAAEEDRRIGHELHDNIQQQLTGLGLLARNLSDALAEKSVPEADLAGRLATGINEATREVHLLSRGLVPVDVDAEGLRSALTDLATLIRERYGIQCILQTDEPVEVADNFVATHLYRIVQEAVNNAVKHGRAERVEISLSGDQETISLRVLDNGIGIGDKLDAVPGMGLRIMQYRAGLIGGTIQIAPAQDRGTLVSCTVLRGG